MEGRSGSRDRDAEDMLTMQLSPAVFKTGKALDNLQADAVNYRKFLASSPAPVAESGIPAS